MPMLPNIVECSTCDTRFRLDRKLIEGYRVARFRCRRCGNPIVVTSDAQVIPGPESILQGRVSADLPPVSLSPSSITFVTPPVREVIPDNIESLDHSPEANCIASASGESDSSANVTTEIPDDSAAPGELFPPALPTEDRVPRSSAGSESPAGISDLDAAFRWKDSGHRELPDRWHYVKISFIVVVGTMITYYALELLQWILDGLTALTLK